MTVWNLNWYNQNSTRRYPLDDSASGEAVDGTELPDNILVDTHLRFPRTAGEYAWVGSVHVSESLVSVTFLSADSISAATAPVLLAVFTADKAVVEPYVQYPLEAAYPGAGGWVVFGTGILDVGFRGQFAGPAATAISPRTARAYPPLPIPETRKVLVAAGLSGLVRLRAGTDLEVVGEDRVIAGKSRRAIVIRLKQDSSRNLLQEYTGPCGGRPESRTCIKPPVEAINAVVPDCDGNIDIQFTRDCVKVGEVLSPNSSHLGLDVDYCLGLDVACTKQRRLPKNGVLPNEYDPDCAPQDPSLLPPPSSDPGSTSPPPSSSCLGPTNLPYIDNFEDGEAQNFVVQSGIFISSSTTYNSNSIILRNTSIWKPCQPAWSNLKGRTVTVEFIMTPEGTNENGGVITGWKFQGGIETFFVAELHQPSGEFRIAYWTGNQFIIKATANPIVAETNKRYKIVLTNNNATNYDISASLYNNAGALLRTLSYQSPAIPYEDDDKVGLNAVRAKTKFDYFKMT